MEEGQHSSPRANYIYFSTKPRNPIFACKFSFYNLSYSTLSKFYFFFPQTDNSVKGSLFWVLDRTLTAFGQRKLHVWISRPLQNLRYALRVCVSLFPLYDRCSSSMFFAIIVCSLISVYLGVYYREPLGTFEPIGNL